MTTSVSPHHALKKSSDQSGSGVSLAVWYWDVISRSSGPVGCVVGSLWRGDCFPQMPLGPIRLLSVESEDQMNTSDSCLRSLSTS